MKVSIIITCYNRERYIARAIRSALDQNFPEDQYEVIVVDDGSTDKSREIIADYNGAIRSIFHEKNMGLPAARNTGIRKARGRFVVHLDSDDYIHEELVKIEYLHLALNPKWGAVACDYVEVDNNESHIRRKNSSSDPIACGLMFRKDYLIDIGLYNEEMLICEDEELRARYEEKYYVGYVQLPLYRYRKHESNMTNDKEAVQAFRNKLKMNNERK